MRRLRSPLALTPNPSPAGAGEGSFFGEHALVLARPSSALTPNPSPAGAGEGSFARACGAEMRWG